MWMKTAKEKRGVRNAQALVKNEAGSIRRTLAEDYFRPVIFKETEGNKPLTVSLKVITKNYILSYKNVSL